VLTVSVHAYDIADVRAVFGKVRNESGRTCSAATDEIGAAVPSNRTTTRHREKGAGTMKLTTITHVSVDGVMQGLGGADEDRRGGFERGGWAIPLFVDEAATFLDQVFQRADAFLFGRRTYEIFAGSWGTGSWGANQGNNPISVALNTRPKYVASTTLTDPRWADTTVLSGDVAAAIGELKAKPGGGAASPRQRQPDPLAPRQPARRRDHPAHLSGWSSARARGCSPTPARTLRLTWSTREPTRRA
jgi:dihydrofolate reductase